MHTIVLQINYDFFRLYKYIVLSHDKINLLPAITVHIQKQQLKINKKKGIKEVKRLFNNNYSLFRNILVPSEYVRKKK